jgi:hypothetical protein
MGNVKPATQTLLPDARLLLVASLAALVTIVAYLPALQN